jgi:hypothetical protein
MSAKTNDRGRHHERNLADGIDVAVVRIDAGRLRPKPTHIAWRMRAFAFPAALAARGAGGDERGSTSTAELARLNWRLWALAYAEAVHATSSGTR